MRCARIVLFVMIGFGFCGCASWSTPTVQPVSVAPERILG